LTRKPQRLIGIKSILSALISEWPGMPFDQFLRGLTPRFYSKFRGVS
jgi:hypothetical protein